MGKGGLLPGRKKHIPIALNLHWSGGVLCFLGANKPPWCRDKDADAVSRRGLVHSTDGPAWGHYQWGGSEWIAPCESHPPTPTVRDEKLLYLKILHNTKIETSIAHREIRDSGPARDGEKVGWNSRGGGGTQWTVHRAKMHINCGSDSSSVSWPFIYGICLPA